MQVHPAIKNIHSKDKRKEAIAAITFCFCFTCCVTIVLRSDASGGPVNLLTAGTVCRRMVWLPPWPKVCVRPGAPPAGAGPIRSNWNWPLSDFSSSVEPCWPGCRFWIAFWRVIYKISYICKVIMRYYCVYEILRHTQWIYNKIQTIQLLNSQKVSVKSHRIIIRRPNYLWIDYVDEACGLLSNSTHFLCILALRSHIEDLQVAGQLRDVLEPLKMILKLIPRPIKGYRTHKYPNQMNSYNIFQIQFQIISKFIQKPVSNNFRSFEMGGDNKRKKRISSCKICQPRSSV